MDQKTLQSIVIDAIRFPLSIMVIFVHMNPDVVNISDIRFLAFPDHGILNILEILISKVIASAAVPTFFLISGFLFYYNFRNWTWGVF